MDSPKLPFNPEIDSFQRHCTSGQLQLLPKCVDTKNSHRKTTPFSRRPVWNCATPAGTYAGKPLQVDIAAVHPKDHKAYVYTGSLTTPPCTEGVRWIVLMQPIEMSNAQIQAFKKLFHDNHRPLQKSGGREVDRESD